MFYYILLQASVLGDLKAESGGQSMWATPIGVIVGLLFLYYILKDRRD